MSQESSPDTGSYAHRDLVAMMRRRRDAEENCGNARQK